MNDGGPSPLPWADSRRRCSTSSRKTSSSARAAASVEGDLARARELGKEAIDLHRTQEQPLGVAAVLIQMGYTELVLGDLERAEEFLEPPSSFEQVEGAAEKAVEEHGRLDTWVH